MFGLIPEGRIGGAVLVFIYIEPAGSSTMAPS
jgi:hypothetical protein